MREIKFRAWDKYNKTWITQPLGFTMSVVDGKFHIFGFDDAFADMYQLKVELQQCTGLKDKNGVEIYEGDIVSVVYATWDEDVLPEIRAVKDIRKDYLWLNSHTLTIKVIGNIYENPELVA